jgi:hypothetical protein
MAENFSNLFSKEKPNLILGICSACEKEVGIDQTAYTNKGWSASHSICGRHTEIYLKTANIPPDRIRAVVEKNTTRDLTDPKNKPLVDWLKNPPQAPKDTEKSH